MPLTAQDLDIVGRKHVTDPAMWGVQVGTDYWLQANGALLTAGRTLITDGGWTATSLSLVAGSAADFGSKTDQGVLPHFLQNAAADLLQSPAIFGQWHHMRAAAVLMGATVLPRYLCAEVHAAFSVASADEVTTNLGFVEDGGSIVVAADTALTVYSNSATFGVQANAAVAAGGTAVDNSPHVFKFILDRVLGTGKVYVDDVLQNTVAALTSDEYPLSFGAGAGTTNRILLSMAHIWYAWTLPTVRPFA